MDESLLQTKLNIPILRSDPGVKTGTGIVPRPRLMERLDAGLSGKLTLISAPAGFGKTTLVSCWLDHIRLPAAWLSLDEDDNDFVRFWTYFVTALQTIMPEAGKQTLALLQSSPPPRGGSLLTPLLNDLTIVNEKVLMVLDDYHIIENPGIDQNLTFLIDHLPPSMHLVIITRADPNIPIAGLRARRQLNELRSDHLRLTTAETTDFLMQMTDLGLTADEVATLERRTEGWIAGLQMATLSLRQCEGTDASKFIEDFSGSHRYIMDYLVDEVLQRQPAEVQAFLLYTSILDQLCSSLCESIMPDEDRTFSLRPNSLATSKTQEILSYLEHSNLFISLLDDQRHWYRYHPLFTDLLRERLNQADPDQIPYLHLRASQWYENAGLFEPAFQHALAARAYDKAAALVEIFAPTMIQRSELTRLLGRIEHLPDEEVRSRPLLAVYYVWALFLAGKTRQAAARLDSLETLLFAGHTQHNPEVLAHTAAMRANLLRENGDFSQAIVLSHRALTNLPELDLLLRERIKLNLTFAYYLQGEFSPALQLLTEIIDNDPTFQRQLNTISAIYIKIQLLRAQGELGQALQLCQDGIEVTARHVGKNFPAAGFLFVAYGDLLRERNGLSTAMEYLERGITLGQEGGIPHISIAGYVWMAWLRQTLGDQSGSGESIRSALQLVQQHQLSRFWPIPPAACWQTRLWIAQGNLLAASRWVQASGLDKPDRPVTFLYEVENLTLARVWIAQRNYKASEMLLHQLQQEAETAYRHGSLIEILVLQAITFEAQKRGDQAMLTLTRALELAEVEGYIRVFLDEGELITGLLRRAVAQNLHAEYAIQLLSAMDQSVSSGQTLAEPLTQREMEVLRRIEAGYSNQEIAKDLVLAISTVKKHVNNIFGKLQVGSRTQAVARARELRLL